MIQNRDNPSRFVFRSVTRMVFSVIKVVLAVLVIGSIVYTTLHFTQVLSEVKAMQHRTRSTPAK